MSQTYIEPLDFKPDEEFQALIEKLDRELCQGLEFKECKAMVFADDSGQLFVDLLLPK